MGKFVNNNRGLTLIELVVTMVIMSILASAILPSVRLTSTRTKEIQLRRDLREIRGAIDEYHREWEKAHLGKQPDPDDNGYPETLQDLVDGVDFGGLSKTKKKFLRKIPTDPMHPAPEGEEKWDLRSYTDDPDASSWGGSDVFDVRSFSDATAIDGTKYKDW